MDKPIVLIVDDQPAIATMIEVVFEDAGFEVYSSASALDAAEQVASLGTNLSALVQTSSLGQVLTAGRSPSMREQRFPFCPSST